MASRDRSFFLNILLVIIGFTAGLALFEGAATAYLTYRDGKYIPAEERFDAKKDNAFIWDIERQGTRCRYGETQYPHPYLGFVHHSQPPCGNPNVNNVGMFGPDYPLQKRQDRFVVLLTGGSVASQLGQTNKKGPRYLEIALNKRYQSPNGKPFLVLNGGAGAWKQPQQFILFSLYADVLDAVVTLDGFNERYRLNRPYRLEYPPSGFFRTNPLTGFSLPTLIMHLAVGRTYGWLRANPVFSRSHGIYLAIQTARQVLDLKDPRRALKKAHLKTPIMTMFALPEDWITEQRFQHAVAQISRYVLQMRAIAHDFEILDAYFIQPAPAIGKPLTNEERANAGKLDYAETYQRYTDSMLKLRDKGVNIHSLLNVYNGIKERLYADQVHLIKGKGGKSRGYTLMADAMADTLAETWNLQKK